MLGRVGLGLVLIIALVCPSSEAGMENARFALHRKDQFRPTKTTPYLCDNPATATEEPNYSPNYEKLPCDSYMTFGPTGMSQIYVVLGQAGQEGVCGVSFGVDYNGGGGVGIDPAFVTWTACADGEQYPNDGGNGDFPKPKGGLQITWRYPGSCQYAVIGRSGVHAVVGSFYVYAYSTSSLRLTPDNNLTSPELAIDDCRGGHVNLMEVWGEQLVTQLLARVDLGGGYGYNSCWGPGPPAPTRAAALSWGRIKNLYGPASPN